MSDRIITMYEGRITGELSGNEILRGSHHAWLMNLNEKTAGGEDHE